MRGDVIVCLSVTLGSAFHFSLEWLELYRNTPPLFFHHFGTNLALNDGCKFGSIFNCLEVNKIKELYEI